MSVNFVSVKCPECGANLSFEEGRTNGFCSYCGAKVLIVNENEHVYRHIDEAKLKQIEVEQTIQLKRLELEENKRTSEQRAKKVKIIITIILGIIMLVGLTTGLSVGSIGGSMSAMFSFAGMLLVWNRNSQNKDD